MKRRDVIIDEAGRYYTEKVQKYGEGPQASDWNSINAQEIRFAQLVKVLPEEYDRRFSVCDYGCGLGDFESYIGRKYTSFSYYGYDASAEMIEAAKKVHGGAYYHDSEITEHYDYIVASGIFNVRQDTNDEDWLSYILETIQMFNKYANEGFAFNCLTKYSDKDHMKDYLYYADPLYLFDYCKKYFSRNVALLHDYTIYDFTIVVRGDEAWKL